MSSIKINPDKFVLNYFIISSIVEVIGLYISFSLSGVVKLDNFIPVLLFLTFFNWITGYLISKSFHRMETRPRKRKK